MSGFLKALLVWSCIFEYGKTSAGNQQLLVVNLSQQMKPQRFEFGSFCRSGLNGRLDLGQKRNSCFTNLSL